VIAHWRERFGDDRIEAIVAGVNAPPAVGLCIDLRNTTRDDAQHALAEAGNRSGSSAFAHDVLVLDGPAPSGELERLANHRWHQHAEAAAFPVDILDPQPGQRIVELCCGRGNKTLQIASRTRDAGALLAVDDDAHKVAQTTARLDQAGIASAALITADARRDPARAPTRTSCCSTRRVRGWGSSDGSRRRAGANTRVIPSACPRCRERCCAPPPAASSPAALWSTRVLDRPSRK